jgi:hypothetical protein
MRTVPVFFYGSYMNLNVLAEVELRPSQLEPAVLEAYELSIRPLANLQPRSGASVFGLLTAASHAELARLYGHAEHVLGGVYLPEAVLVRTLDGRYTPALCYISQTLQPSAASADYVERILAPAQQHGFPTWYLDHIAAFKP